jgi:hypothetical protein
MTAPTAPAGPAGRLRLFCRRHELKIAWAEVVVLFLALIRTITSVYMVRTGPGDVLPAGQVEPVITGATVAAVFCLALTLLGLAGRRRVMHVVFVLAIVSLVLVKVFLFTG